MKSVLTVLTLVAVAIFVTGVANASHIDLSGCKACHVPHGTDSAEGVPLWSGLASDQNFIMYDDGETPITQITSVIGDQPTGATKLCLSCHDGFGNSDIGVNPAGVLHSSNMGLDLSMMHPVSFEYAPASASLPEEYKHKDDLPAGFLDRKGDVQCSSCHDVHLSGGRSIQIGIDEIAGTDPDTGEPIIIQTPVFWEDADGGSMDVLLRGNGFYIDGYDGGSICQSCHLKGVGDYTPPEVL